MNTYHLKISAILPVALCFFDGLSNNNISKIANLPIIFLTGDYMNLDFYITLLDFLLFGSWIQLACMIQFID